MPGDYKSATPDLQEAEDLATRYRQRYARQGKLAPPSTSDDCACKCGNLARFHKRTNGGIGGCLMAGCSCTQFEHATGQV